MGHAVDVALSTHVLDNNAGQSVVFTCHALFLLLKLFRGNPQASVPELSGQHALDLPQPVQVYHAAVLHRDEQLLSVAVLPADVALPSGQRRDPLQQVLLVHGSLSLL